MLGILFSLIVLLINVYIFIYVYTLYFGLLFMLSAVQNKSIKIGLLSVVAAFIQFYGYGTGYVESLIKIHFLKQEPHTAFPKLFFR